jgi:hypothetical protein
MWWCGHTKTVVERTVLVVQSVVVVAVVQRRVVKACAVPEGVAAGLVVIPGL